MYLLKKIFVKQKLTENLGKVEENEFEVEEEQVGYSNNFYKEINI